MNFISRLVTTAFILPMGLGFAAPANAADSCREIIGGYACVSVFSSLDVVEANLPILGGVETMQITCADGGWKYTSNGSWTKSSVETFVTSYCETRGYYAHD